MKRVPIALVVLAGLPLAACQMPEDPARASIARGHAVAQKWCSGCHQISRDQPVQAGKPLWAQGPSFSEVAANPNADREYLRGLANEFYFPMPAFHVRKQDQEDVISYILALRNQI